MLFPTQTIFKHAVTGIGIETFTLSYSHHNPSQHWLSLPHWNSAPTQHKLPLPENHRATLYVIALGAGLSHLTLNARGGHSLLVPFYRQG